MTRLLGADTTDRNIHDSVLAKWRVGNEGHLRAVFEGYQVSDGSDRECPGDEYDGIALGKELFR